MAQDVDPNADKILPEIPPLSPQPKPIDNGDRNTTIAPPGVAVPTQEKIPIKVKMPPVVWNDTQEVLKSINTKLGGAVVTYFTRGSIVSDDVKYFYSHLKTIGHQEKLFFIITSRGGDGMSAYRIASLLKKFCDELIIVVPEVAASAATMLSLAGDKIIMSSFSYLTAVDTSIVHPLNPLDVDKKPVRIELEEIKRSVSALSSTFKADESQSKVYETIFSYLHPAAFGALERASNLSEMLCKDILSLRKNPPSEEEASVLINKLNKEYPSHGYPIVPDKAQSLGLPVELADEETNNLLWSLINFYRYITEPVRTDFNDSSFHSEQYMNVIESVGRRLGVKNVLERRLDPIIKNWTTLRNDFVWEALFEKEENGEKKLIKSNLNF
ncbi:hypothetical protein C4561_04475 [candidate division WWE3 bacterium]|uniref:Serine dehydrogenase proteinase n=1 Tax=candidate division WWE3 bacterium TaxID=2053526 RepID=A0A3A4ZCM8_UNCKA|nr:MAG: hypothetical protein C4561_04475 [candidate division WWE3 bacterium]